MASAGDGLDHVLGAVFHLGLDAELLFERGEQLVVWLLRVVLCVGGERRLGYVWRIVVGGAMV